MDDDDREDDVIKDDFQDGVDEFDMEDDARLDKGRNEDDLYHLGTLSLSVLALILAW